MRPSYVDAPDRPHRIAAAHWKLRQRVAEAGGPPREGTRAVAVTGRARPVSRRTALRTDDQAVSEVVGYLLTFSIISTILILAMIAFIGVQQQVSDSIVEERARSAAQRVAAAAVQASLLAERYGSETEFSQALTLPQQLEGHSYTIALEGGPGLTDRVRVVVPGADVNITTTLFALGAAEMQICPTTVQGGTFMLRYGERQSMTCLFLEEI